MPEPTLQNYAELLEGLEFVDGADLVGSAKSSSDVVVDVRTATGVRRLAVELKTSHLSREAVEAMLSRLSDPGGVIVFAPAVGAGLGDRMAGAGLNFLDLHGNCFLRLAPGYVARVQRSTTPKRPAVEAAIRGAGYQVLFALLAKPELMVATVREVAAAAGVSRQPVQAMRERLVEMGYAVKLDKGYAWIPARMNAGLDMWVHGYAHVLRPRLLEGRFRTQLDASGDLTELERRLEDGLGSAAEWAFGGSAAGDRLTGYYRGSLTVVHAAAPNSKTRTKMRMTPDPAGPIVFVRPPSPLGLTGPEPRTAHPLLVYSELLMEHDERATEAAGIFLERFPMRA